MNAFTRLVKGFVSEEDGASAVEYAILVAVIAVAVFAAVKVFNLNSIFETVNTKVDGCVTGSSC